MAGSRFLLDAGFRGLAGNRLLATGGRFLLDAGFCDLAGGRLLLDEGFRGLAGGRFPLHASLRLPASVFGFPALFFGLLPSVFGFRQVPQVLSRLRIVEPQPPAGHPQLQSQYLAPRRQRPVRQPPPRQRLVLSLHQLQPCSGGRR